MAKINSYPFDSTIQDADAWIGTDSTNRSTKQYTAEAVAAYTVGGLISGGTINTLPIFTSTGLADSLVRQDISGIVYIGPEDNVRLTGDSVNAPILIGTDLYTANIYGQNGGLLNIQGNAIIGNEATDTLVVNSVSTFNAAVADGTGSVGTAGQVLSSTVTGTAWVNPAVEDGATLVVIACKNTSGATITKGTPVYQTGTVGATATIEIAPADALISANKLPAIGLLQTDLNNNGSGNVVITGELLSIITSPIDGVTPTTGDKVFLKSGGGLTLTKPTGSENGIQNLGLIGKVSTGNAGTITVSSIMRTNDVPNLPEGRIWVGDGNTIVSDVVYIDEPNAKLEVAGNVLIQTTTDVDNLKIVSTNTSLGGAPDIVLLADVPAITGDSHGDILFQGQNGMVPGAGNILTYTGLFSKMFDKDNNHSSLVMTTHKGNGGGAQALTATFSAKGTNNAATGTLLINPSSVTEVASYNLEVKGDALVQDNLIVDANIGIGIANPQRELDVDGGVRIRGTLDLFQGNNNSFAGQNAGNLLNIVAGSNTGFGKNSQLVNISGSANTSMGASSLGALVTGNSNTAIGINSMVLLNGGNRNVAVGSGSLSTATTGNGNTAIGHNSLGNTTTTNFNTAVGQESLANITTGSTNTGIGNEAGKFTSDGTTANATGNFSVFIGDSAKAQANAQSNQIVIGYDAIGNGSNTATIGNTTTTALHVGGNNAGIVLKSPDGTAYTITVSNAGALVVS
jgi:hypothetical protein